MGSMRMIEPNGSGWTTELDFYRELGHAVSDGQDVACNVKVEPV
jgi:hypothetical protein